MTSLFDRPLTPLDSFWMLCSDGIGKRFSAFHSKNPHVYAALVVEARSLQRVGHAVYGMAGLFEVLRWKHAMTTADVSGFKLSNDYRAYYARLIMICEPDLDGFFNVRELRS